MVKTLLGKLRRVARQWPPGYLVIAVPLAVPLVVAALGTEPASSRAASLAAMTPDLQLRYDDLRTPPADTLPEHSYLLTFESGDTLDSIFTAGGLSRAESAQLTAEFARTIDVRRLRPGHIVRFHVDAQNRVDAVRMHVIGWGEIEALRSTSGPEFTVSARPAEQREVLVDVSAEIRSTLHDALQGTGEKPQLAQQILDIFQWDVDFFELSRGDSFSLVVPKRYVGSDFAGYGPVAAARFVHKGEQYEAFRHTSADGTAGYYNRHARPVRKQFLRAPLAFTRITSGFSRRRFHPVLNYFRPHHGVDYGAPVGTPVMTTADGVVVEARYKSGFGNFVRVRHTSRTDTYYLHLSRFAKNMKKGTRVTQGDVIGYVGMTGLASGPHLDYRVNEGGKWLDPLKLKSITPDPLAGESLRRYKASVAALLPRLESPASEAQVASSRRALF